MMNPCTRARLRGDALQIWTTGLLACLIVISGACQEGGTPVEDSDLSALLDDGAIAAALSDGDGEDLSESLSSIVEALAAEEDVEFAMGIDGDEQDDFAPDCRIEPLRDRVFSHFDVDDNGALSQDEARQLRAAFGPKPFRRHRFTRHHRLARLRWIYDADDSRDLSTTERDELRMDVEMRCMNRFARLLEHWDADESGDLDFEEWTAAREALRERKRARRAAFILEYDEDEDGWLDLGERLAAVSERVKRILDRRDAAILEYDVDGDGRLDTDERTPLRERLRTRVRGEQWAYEAPEDDDITVASAMTN